MGGGSFAEYGVYGVTIASEISLALPPRRDEGLVTIALRQVPPERLREAVAGTPLQARAERLDFGVLAGGAAYARWQGVGEFLVSPDGLEIQCAPTPGALEESFQVYLLGQALSFALVKAGFEPLHATVVEQGEMRSRSWGRAGRG